jgi:rSAM/selenodomain-associated transferase 2/rSAM/selenodomain-associated transferase 1
VKLAIVIPTLNEGRALLHRLKALAPLRERGALVVVVDGGSSDNTLTRALPLADQVLSAPRGRAAQMNAGAWALPAAAAVDALLFLHADTMLPPDADALIAEALARPGHLWGRFDVQIRGRHPLLPMVAALMNWRSRLSGIATGDQGIFVKRRTFEALGGFAPQPLMEDVELSRRLKQISPPACIEQRVTTSGRRWDQHGFWNTVLLMWRLRWSYARGVNAITLARRYDYTPRPPAAVAVLAKAPLPGLAKTRLIPLLGAAGAARAQRQMTLQTIATARHASTGPLTLWCAPDADQRFFRALAARHGVACQTQAAGDLGERMAEAMTRHFALLPKLPWLVVGTDCPALTPAHLQQVADALKSHEAVLIPADDGGYVLLGLKRPLPSVFERVDWGTSDVLAQTRKRLREVNALWVELPALWDVDEPADWQRWQAGLQGRLPGTAEAAPP